ncbi:MULTISPECIES: lipopolysaccharide assembly protein LapB [Anaerolinea]|uniref:tetratricopeptide repeat protein n=1 Tax=Anaerolinea TaxID=233189 RepID=UPI0026052CE6|nr:tetratricopeptide repeat protein [Anaerolinea thermophila]
MAQKYLFRKRSSSNPYTILALTVVLLALVAVLRGLQTQQIEPLFLPTPTPTRTSNSYALEGQTHFQAGNLKGAIEAYQQALQTEPNNARIWMELAQIQTYSYKSLTTREAQRQRLAEALESANRAVELAPEDSSAYAIRAFVRDWNAGLLESGEERSRLLVEAEQDAQKALLLDKNNVLALAYSAEILNDQQKWDQARQYIQLAVERNPNLMDVWRVQAAILETLGDYQGAIQAYDRAIELAPNLTFLYVQAGVIYRHLGMTQTQKNVAMQYYTTALDYFAKAVNKNKQLGIEDPVPYIAIGKVYTQMGEFFVAALNAKKALQIDPYSPDLYGQLGMVYFKARNYETAIPALQCAVEGCPPQVSCEVRDCDPATDPPIEIQGIPLEPNDPATVVYYYTYGSVLAGMYRPVGETRDYCDRALKVFDRVRALYASDSTVMGIVQASESICASFGITRNP